ncbi:hypothetical protein H4S14_004331, partial [Agrobacterium vitis]|nr:hypothetical protein [Agrobacterium vitis]MBE1440550.1 hypothetical protein [Agrobacterium vitis]
MDRINGADTVDIGSSRRGFRDENLVAGVAGTEVTADFLNSVQEEIMKVVTEAGLAPSASDWTQLWQALQIHGLSSVNRSRLWLAVTSMTVSSPPASPASGDTYLIPLGASGVWSANVGKIAQWTGSAWAYLTPPNGHGISLPDGRIFERINGAYVEFLASRDWAANRTAAVTKLSRLPWLPVLSMTLSSAPGSPAVGDTYLIPSNATGIWATNVGKIAEWVDASWSYLTPPDGHCISLPDGRVFERIAGTYTELLASEIRAGLVKLATVALAIAGVDTTSAVTPAGLASTLSNIVPPRPNLCPNGGFENGIGNIAVTKSGSGTWPSSITTNSWGRSIVLTGTKTDGTYVIAWPKFVADAGATYTISGDAALIAASGTVRYQIAWLDAADTVLSISTGPSRSAGDYSDSNARRQAMAGFVTAPASAVSAQLQCVFDVVGATYIGARLAKVEKGGLPATAYTPPTPTIQH